MKRTFATLLVLALSACAVGPEPKAELDAKEAKELALALEGKVAGKPVSCVSIHPSANLQAVGDRTLVYRVSKRLVYRNDLIGACHGLRHGDALVTQVWGSQYCRGDIAHAVDLTSGIWGGSCALGAFVPYTAAPATGG